MTDTTTRCPFRIGQASNIDALLNRPGGLHLECELEDGHDDSHQARWIPYPDLIPDGTTIHWYTDDRRTHIGSWERCPEPTTLGGEPVQCVLPAGHIGGHAG